MGESIRDSTELNTLIEKSGFFRKMSLPVFRRSSAHQPGSRAGIEPITQPVLIPVQSEPT